MRLIAVLMVLVGLVVAPAASGHVPKITSKTITDGPRAGVSDFLAPESVYGTIFRSNMGGECGAGLNWLCGESKYAKPYEGVDGVSRVGSHSRWFRVRFNEYGPGYGRTRVCIQRRYHLDHAETWDCDVGIDQWYGFWPAGPA